MKSQSFLNNILNNFLEHVFVLDINHKIIFCSDSPEALFGFSKQEIIEKGFKNLFLGSRFSFEDVLKKAEKYGEFIGTENFEHKSRSFINVAYRLNFQQDEETGENIFVFYLRDNTQNNIIRRDIIKKSLTIENLSRSRKIRDGKLEEAIFELLESSSRAMNVTRVNAWVFDKGKNEIRCIGNFDARENKLVPQSALPRIAMPGYFSLFETEKIIITNDAFKEAKTAELLDFYLKPLNIHALMDIPVRIEGEMIGVICFEHIDSPREWTLQEQKYALVAAQMLSLIMETSNKQKAKAELEVSLAEQKILLQEVHHRVKNNLSIVASLINLQKDKAKDNFHKDLFLECRNRIDSISTVHELIYKAKSYSRFNFKDYLSQILDHISSSYGSKKNIKITQELTDVDIDISYSIPLALIVNELITNSFKHAFSNDRAGIIKVLLHKNKSNIFLTISDNGSGFDKSIIPQNSIGMDILSGLIDQIDGTYDFTSNENGTQYKISFSKK